MAQIPLFSIKELKNNALQTKIKGWRLKSVAHALRTTRKTKLSSKGNNNFP
jgi:hypothetical protein